MKFFEIYELEPLFSISEEKLKKKYIQLQKKNHPDKFAVATDAEKKRALLQSSIVNDAYEVLKNDIKRALYLLDCNKIKIGNINNSKFLMQQMDYEEFLEENSANKNKLQELHQKVTVILNDELKIIENFFKKNQLESVAKKINELIFLEKFIHRIKERLNFLD
jgi:molecular chaperone HscB